MPENSEFMSTAPGLYGLVLCFFAQHFCISDSFKCLVLCGTGNYGASVTEPVNNFIWVHIHTPNLKLKLNYTYYSE